MNRDEFKYNLIRLLEHEKKNGSFVILKREDSEVWSVYGKLYYWMGEGIKPLFGSSKDRLFLENILKEVGIEYVVSDDTFSPNS